jgi:endonuclease/exonuclease/phosphatase family metal-dependent hydrolase
VQRYIGVVGLALAAAAVIWLGRNSFEVQGLDQISVQPRAPDAAGDGTRPAPVAGDAIRVASFNIQVFGQAKVDNPRLLALLAAVCRGFDLVAIQEVRSQSQDVLPRLVEAINAEGRRYDYAVGPRLGRTSSKEQYAFVFDTATIEIDRSCLYTVEDPGDRLHREPLVAWFRARGPPPSEAFTFTLVNLHTDPDETDTEVAALAEVYRAVRDDGRGEDDTILLGDFNVDERGFGPLAALPDVYWVVSGIPTNTRGTRTYDNLLFNRRATEEFTGRGGVYDLLAEHGLTVEQALEVSDHLPVWGEFSRREGGQPGRFATRPFGEGR